MILGNSLLLDRLLPEKPVAIGDSWKHSEKFMAQFLSLDEVGQSDVQSTLKEVTDDGGSIRDVGPGGRHGQGRQHGNRNQGPLPLRPAAKPHRLARHARQGEAQCQPGDRRFRRRGAASSRCCRRNRLAGLERRDLEGHFFQIHARIAATRTSLEAGQLGDDLRSELETMSRRRKDKAELHLFDKGEHIAHCTISPLPPGDPEKLVTLEAFQEELRTALDKKFRRIRRSRANRPRRRNIACCGS